jgi:hypothetical protein
MSSVAMLGNCPLDGTGSPLTANKVSIPILSSIDYNISNNNNSNSQPAVDSRSLHATNHCNKMETATPDMGWIEMARGVCLGRRALSSPSACKGGLPLARFGIGSQRMDTIALEWWGGAVCGSSMAWGGRIVAADRNSHDDYRHSDPKSTIRTPPEGQGSIFTNFQNLGRGLTN